MSVIVFTKIYLRHPVKVTVAKMGVDNFNFWVIISLDNCQDRYIMYYREYDCLMVFNITTTASVYMQF